MIYVRVRVLRTGHQVDIVADHFDPARHDIIPRFLPTATPRRPKYRVRYRGTTSAAPAVDPNQAGTGEKEAGP